MANEFDVSPEELQRIFDELIQPRLFRNAKPYPRGERPVLVQLGGQLAAGKSHALNDIVVRHGGRIVQLSPDQLRTFHPRYEEIMRDRPHEMVPLTSQAMYVWSDMVRQYAHQHGCGIVVEGTFRSPEYLVQYAQEAAQPVPGVHDGFLNEIVVVATPREQSALDMVGRYLADPPGEGRWADIGGHDVTFDQLPLSVEILENTPQIDRVIVTDRAGTIHYDNSRGPDGAWQQPARAAEALREARSEGKIPFNAEQAQKWLNAYWKNSADLIAREELNPTTAPTMLALHQHADRVAHVAYADDPERMAQHETWQKVQKIVFQAGERGVPNTQLPRHPEEFMNASKEEKTRFYALVAGALKETSQDLPKDAVEAVKRAQQGVAPPMRGTSTSPSPQAAADKRQGREKDPGLER